MPPLGRNSHARPPVNLNGAALRRAAERNVPVGWALLPVLISVFKPDGQVCPSYDAVRQLLPVA